MPDNEEIASIINNLGADAFPQTNYSGQAVSAVPAPVINRARDADGNLVPGIDLNLLDAFLAEKGYLDPAISEWEQQNNAVQDALYENNMFEQSSRWQGQYDAIHSVLREQEDANIKSIVNVDTTYYSNPRWVQYPPNIRDTSDSSYPGFVKAPNQNRSSNFVTDEISTCISVLKLSKNNELLMEYTFYVSPESLEINAPSRVGVYQSIGGATYIDHMGSGVTSISLTGHTGFQRQPSKAFWHLNFGYLQYLLLKKIVNKYNDECAMGNAHLLTLTLTLSFPDAPQYGHWDVSIKELVLRRSIQQVMKMQYTLSLVCLSDNKIQVARPTLAVTRVLPDRPVQSVAPESIQYVPRAGEGVGPDGRDEYIPAPAPTVSAGPARQPPPDLGDGKPIPKKTPTTGELATVTAPPQSFMYKVPTYPANYDDRYSQFHYKNRNVRLLKNDTTSNSRSKVEYVGTLFDNASSIEKTALMNDSNKATIVANISIGQTTLGTFEPLLTIENFTGSLTNYAPLGAVDNQWPSGIDSTKRVTSKLTIQAKTNTGRTLIFNAIYLPATEWPYGTLGDSTGRGYDMSSSPSGQGQASRGVYAIWHDKAYDKITSDTDIVCSSQTMTIIGTSLNSTSAVSLFTNIALPSSHYEDPSISAVISVASWATDQWNFVNPGFKIQRLVALNSSPALTPRQSEKTLQPMRFASSSDASKLPSAGVNDTKKWRIDNFFVPIFKDIIRKNFDGTSMLTLRGEFKTALSNYGQNEGDWYQNGAQFIITLWKNVDSDLTLNQAPLISTSEFGNMAYKYSVLDSLNSTKTLTLQHKTTLSGYVGSQNAVGGLLVTTTAGNFYASKVQFPYMYENTYPGSISSYTEEAHVIAETSITGPQYSPTTLNLSRDTVVSADNVPLKSFTTAQDYVSVGVAAAQLPNAVPISNIAGFRADVTFNNSYVDALSAQFTNLFRNSITYVNYLSVAQVVVGTQFVLFPTLSNSMYGAGGLPLSLLDVSKIERLDKTIQWSIDAPRTLGEIVFFFYGYDVNEDQSGGNQQYIDDGAGAFVANPGKQVAQAIVNMNPNLFGDVSLEISLERLIPVLNVVKLPANIPNVTLGTFDLLNTPFVKELQRQDSSFFTFPANPS